MIVVSHPEQFKPFLVRCGWIILSSSAIEAMQVGITLHSSYRRSERSDGLSGDVWGIWLWILFPIKNDGPSLSTEIFNNIFCVLAPNFISLNVRLLFFSTPVLTEVLNCLSTQKTKSILLIP